MRRILPKCKIALFILPLLPGCSTGRGLETQKPKLSEEEVQAITFEKKAEERQEALEDLLGEVELLEFEAPQEGEAPQEEADGLSDSERVIRQVQEATFTPKREVFKGGAVVYNYKEGYIYQVFSRPGMVTDILLEPGEKVTSPPVIGDMDNFVIGNSLTTAGGQTTEIINILPAAAYRETSLAVYTTRRVYKFHLQSFKNTYMPLISFQYPLSLRQKMQERQKKDNSRIQLSGDITDYYFGYDILPMSVHKPLWMPSMVFSDQKRTYIFFPSAEATSYAPALFAVRGKERTILNYSVAGQYYIVNEVLDRAELVVDVNAGNVISIIRTGRR